MIFKTLLVWSLILLLFTLWKVVFIAYGLYTEREILKSHKLAFQEAFNNLSEGSATEKEVEEALLLLERKSKNINFLGTFEFAKETLKNIYKKNTRELTKQGLYEK